MLARMWSSQAHWSRGQWMARAGVALLLALTWLWTCPSSAFAADKQGRIYMSSTVGFNGFYGKDQWTPINLTIRNTGQATAAELQVNVNFPFGAAADGRYADGTLRWPIQLPAGGAVSSQIAVPGPIVDENAWVVLTVHGQVVAQARLAGTAVGNFALVAVLSDEPQAAQFLMGTTNGSAGEPVLPIVLKPGSLPSSADLFNGLTALSLSPETLAGLRSNQRQALLEWVKLGGLLVVTGTANHGGWQAQLPLLPGKQRVSGAVLSQYLGDSVTQPKDIVAASDGVQPLAEVWAGTADNPDVGALRVGRGTVVQTSFLATQPNLLTWPSNAALWTKILQAGSAHSASALPGLLSSGKVLQLASASDSLSPLKVPSLSFWASVFAIYVLLVGPVLFYVLRSFKAEPLAWGILPLLSIVTTLVIYIFGAAERPSGILTEGVGVLDLVGDGTAESYGIRAFTSPSVTSGIATTQAPMLTLPLKQVNVRELGSADVVNSGPSTFSFENIGRWGVRYMYTAGVVAKQGQLHNELWASPGTITGTVHNDTPYTMHNVGLCWNGRMYQLGDLAPGQQVGVNQDTSSVQATGGYLSAYGSYNREVTRGIGRPLATLAQSEGLFTMSSDAHNMSQAMVVATTDKAPALPDFVTDQPTSANNTVVLVRQFATVTVYPLTGVTLQ